MKFSHLSAITLFALSSSVCTAEQGAGYSTKFSPKAHVRTVMNEFFGPNIYTAQETIETNAQYNVANLRNPTQNSVCEETCKKIKGRIVSDVKDEARKILNDSVISPGAHDQIVTAVGKAAEKDFDPSEGPYMM